MCISAPDTSRSHLKEFRIYGLCQDGVTNNKPCIGILIELVGIISSNLASECGFKVKNSIKCKQRQPYKDTNILMLNLVSEDS